MWWSVRLPVATVTSLSRCVTAYPVPVPKNPRDTKPLDPTDLALVRLLEQDGRMSNAMLAREVGIAESTCLVRVRSLVFARNCIPSENRPSKARFMPDDSKHIFTNQALYLTQLPDRPKAKPPEIFIP